MACGQVYTQNLYLRPGAAKDKANGIDINYVTEMIDVNCRNINLFYLQFYVSLNKK